MYTDRIEEIKKDFVVCSRADLEEITARAIYAVCGNAEFDECDMDKLPCVEALFEEIEHLKNIEAEYQKMLKKGFSGY